MAKRPLTALLDLPNEVILLIAENIDDFQQICDFLITNRRIASIVVTALHRLAARSGIYRSLVALLWAIANKNESMLRVLLTAGPRTITILGNSGETTYMVSHAKTVDLATIAKIFSEGITVNIRVRKGKYSCRVSPALHWAARAGNEALVRLLLDKGADIEVKDQHGHTALHCAATMQRGAIIELLLSRGANRLVTGVFGDKPLDRAKFYHHTDIVMQLLEDSDVNAVYQKRRTALHIAAEHPDDDFAAAAVKSLLERGASMNENYGGYYGVMPIYLAIQQGNIKVVRQLVEAGAWKFWWSRGHSILHGAIIAKRYEIAKYLIETAPEGFVENSYGTLFHRAIELPLVDAELIKMLLKKGVPVDRACCRLHTPLHNSVRRGHREIVELLIEYGADVNLRTIDGSTPLIFAASGVAWRPFDTYVEQYRRGTCDDMLAIARLLLDQNSQIDVQDYFGRTALHHAVIARGEAMVTLLLEAGADPTIVDSGWRSAMELARANITSGPEEAAIFRLLEERAINGRANLQCDNTYM